jgi:hypothetical protein
MITIRRVVVAATVAAITGFGIVGVANASDDEHEPQHHGHHYYQDHDKGFAHNLSTIGHYRN